MDNSRTKKIVSEFLTAHTYHIPRGCQYFRNICPFCDIIVCEQTDTYPEILRDMFRPSVETSWNYWDRSAIHIGDRVDRERFLEELVWLALARWVQPKYRDISTLEEDEILNHPYVLQKIRPNI